jgi:hypothetical protein
MHGKAHSKRQMAGKSKKILSQRGVDTRIELK